jgi:hypothetical protein
VNRLVDALRAHPEVIDRAVQGEEVPFRVLAEQLGRALLSPTELELMVRSPDVERLYEGYLPVITAPDWQGALSQAEDDDGDQSGWWTVMIPATGKGVGLTAPQDSSGLSLIALFTGPANNARTLVYDPALGRLVPPSVLVHCYAPSRGECAPGTCGGCRRRQVLDKTNGLSLRCRCRDQTQ